MVQEQLFDDKYWDNASRRIKLPCRWSSLSDLDLHRHLKYYIRSVLNSDNMSVLEIGCAPGRYLAYFGKNYNCRLYGIEKSTVGVEVTRKNLEYQKLEGTIVNSDVFENDSASIQQGMFDIVMSHGFVEHFDDLSQIMEVKYGYARPGGLIITTVPNFNGMSGYVAKLLAREVYDQHEKFDPQYLSDVQTALGGKVLFCSYTGHYQIRPPFQADTKFKRRHPLIANTSDLPFKVFNGLSCVTSWFLLKTKLLPPPNSLLSKRITSIAVKE